MNNAIRILEWPEAIAGSVILGERKGINLNTLVIICVVAFAAGLLVAQLSMPTKAEKEA